MMAPGSRRSKEGRWPANYNHVGRKCKRPLFHALARRKLHITSGRASVNHTLAVGVAIQTSGIAVENRSLPRGSACARAAQSLRLKLTITCGTRQVLHSFHAVT